MNGWGEVSLGDLIDIHDHKRVPLSSAQRANRKGPYPYYGAQGVIDHIDNFIFDGRFLLIPEDGENLRSRKLPVAYFAEGKFWVNNHAHIVRAKEGIANDRFVQSAIEATDISPFVNGAAQPKLSQANLRRIPLLVPDLPTQQRVASILDALDNLIGNIRRRIVLMEQMAQAIYREWFVHFRMPGEGTAANDVAREDESPWEWITLGDAGRWLSGGTPRTSNPEYWGGPIPWITSGTLTSMLLDRSDRRVTGAGLANGTRLVERDTLLFVVRGMSLVKEFRVGIADVPVAFGQDLKALIAGPEVRPLFLAFAVICMAEEIQGMVELAGHGTGKLSTDRLQAICIPKPPLDVQDRFVATVTPLREEMSLLRDAADRLDTMRTLLLPKLVTGQIDVSDLDLDMLVEQVS